MDYQAEIDRLRKQIAILHTQHWVGTRLGEVLAAQLAATPYLRWTPTQKAALHAVCGDAVVALALYIDSLPQEVAC